MNLEKKQFNNTPTNKQREKFWTYNREKFFNETERDAATINQLEDEDFGAKDIGY
jgi:hypothetical protein